MVDLSGIRAAIATKVGAVSGIALSTSSNFGGVVDVPAYLVNTVKAIDTVDHEALSQEFRELEIDCDLLLAKTGDINDAVTNADALVESIYTASYSGITLGFPTVVYDSWIDKTERGALTYAGQEWEGATQRWKVRLRETIDRSA